MKKVLALILALVLAMSLAACGGGNQNEEAETTAVETTTEPQITDMELCAEIAVETLKEDSRNPSTIVINKLQAVAERVGTEDQYIYKIDFNEQNRFGGSERDYYYIKVFKENGEWTVDPLRDRFMSIYQEYFDEVSEHYDLDTKTYRIIRK